LRRSHWFLPESPDVFGQLRDQLAVTIEGFDAFAAWTAGDHAAAAAVRAAEHRADAVKRDLHRSLRTAFVLPVEPEDLFTLSRGIDALLNAAKDVVGESEVIACAPDAAMARMAVLLARAIGHIDQAVGLLAAGHEDAAQTADAAVKEERRLEKEYRAAMAALLRLDDLREVTARRELYRRCARIGDGVVDVAERVVYTELKGT
jgi:uncharacterized protein Yka (UPF0111/DUF47 family)